MGLPERPTDDPRNQEGTRGRCPTRRPRTRRCLLKGCEQCFPPQRAAERYCSEECRKKAREWSEWKAQQKYRATLAGKEKRKAQSRRYRERVWNRKAQIRLAADERTRVISPNFFRFFLRPARLLRRVPTHREISSAKVLFEAVSTCVGACFRAGTTMARAADRITAARNYCQTHGNVRAARGECVLPGDGLDVLTHAEKFP